MNWNEINQQAKERFHGACRVCRVCNGATCAGEMPGMGGVGTGSSFSANVEALASYKMVLRTIHDATDPAIGLSLFGHELQTPILGAAVAGTRINMSSAVTELELAQAMIGGCVQAGSLGMIGDGPDPTLYSTGLGVLAAQHGRGIAIIKPRPADQIIARIRQAEEAGAWAVGVDIDAAGIINMTRAGQLVRPHPLEAWQEIISQTRLPFVLKGVMTADEAELALDAGAEAIVVSNHGGRILDHLPGTAEVLPEIAEAVRGDLTILVDGGIRSGVDVLKMLALGADAVLIGRPLAIAAVGGGAEAVGALIARYTDELRSAMILTGCESLAVVDEGLLYG
jgi:4-hydroxymandelate oxidase